MKKEEKDMETLMVPFKDVAPFMPLYRPGQSVYLIDKAAKTISAITLKMAKILVTPCKTDTTESKVDIEVLYSATTKTSLEIVNIPEEFLYETFDEALEKLKPSIKVG